MNGVFSIVMDDPAYLPKCGGLREAGLVSFRVLVHLDSVAVTSQNDNTVNIRHC